MITTTVSSSSLAWLAWEFAFVLISIAGGVAIWRGLWLEKKANREWYSNTDDFLGSKIKEKRGENWVIAGIIIEIAVAVFFTAKGGWEMKQLSDNTPAKMRVSSIEATADFFVETNRDDSGTWGELPPKGWTRGGEPEKEKPPCPRIRKKPTMMSSRNRPCSC